MNSMSSLSTTLPAPGGTPATGSAAENGNLVRHRPGGIFSRFELTGKVAVISGGARGLGRVDRFFSQIHKDRIGFTCHD